MFAKSLSPSQRDQIITKVGLEKRRLQQKLYRSESSNKTSRSPRARQLDVNQSQESYKNYALNRSKVQSAVEVLKNKLTASRSYRMMMQPPTLNVQVNVFTPTARVNRDMPKESFLSKLVPSSSRQQHHNLQQSFFSRKQQNRQENISNRIIHLKQGIDKCLKQLEMRRFQLIKKLGSGINGDVMLARIRNLNFIVALKVIKKSEAVQHARCFLEEIKIQSYLDHPNVVKLYGLTSDKENIYMIMEVSSNNLFREIKQEVQHQLTQRGFSQDKARAYIKQVLQALSYLHSHSIIHRDVKPENVLNCHGVLKLCDFGWSTYNGQNAMRKTFCGTYDYVSPEVSQGCLYDQQVDAWAVGVLTYQMLTATVPFKQKLMMEQQPIHFPQRMSRAVKDFISRLLIFSPKRRMTVEEALQHPWVVQDEYDKDEWLPTSQIQMLNLSSSN